MIKRDMTEDLRLTIATPSTLLVDALGVESIRAEDESGSFGVLRGHADLLTVLSASVVRWRLRDGSLRCCAVRGGVLTVTGGAQVSIACRQAVLGDDLEKLEAEVRALRAAQADVDKRARVEQTRLHAHAVRQLMRYLRPTAPRGEIVLEREEEAP